MKNKVVILAVVLVILLLNVSMFNTVRAAPAALTVTYNGIDYGNGDSIHYNGDVVTVTVNSPIPDCDLTMTGTNVSVNEQITGSSISKTFTLPSGPITVTVSKGIQSQSIIVNMYRNTPLDPGAALSYYSYRLEVKSIDSNPASGLVDYDGITDTGANKSQLNDLLKKQTLMPGSYNVSGTLFVNVFKYGVWQGGYDTLTGIKQEGPGPSDLYDSSSYTWGTVKAELRQRGNWAFNYVYDPDCTLTVKYIDIDTMQEISPAKYTDTYKLLDTPTESKIDISIHTFVGSKMGYSSNLDSVAVQSGADTQTMTFSAPDKLDGYIYFYYKSKVQTLMLTSPQDKATVFVGTTINITGSGSYNTSIVTLVNGAEYGAPQPQDNTATNNSYSSTYFCDTAGTVTFQLKDMANGFLSNLVTVNVIPIPNYIITVEERDYSTDAQLSSTDIAGIKGTQSVSAPARSNSTLEGSYVVYDSSLESRSLMMPGASSQSVTLDDVQNHAWVVFYYTINSAQPTARYNLDSNLITATNQPYEEYEQGWSASFSGRSTTPAGYITTEEFWIYPDGSGSSIAHILMTYDNTKAQWYIEGYYQKGMFDIGRPLGDYYSSPYVDLTFKTAQKLKIKWACTNSTGGSDFFNSYITVTPAKPVTWFNSFGTFYPIPYNNNKIEWNYFHSMNVPYSYSTVKIVELNTDGSDGPVIADYTTGSLYAYVQGVPDKQYKIYVSVTAQDGYSSYTAQKSFNYFNPVPSISIGNIRNYLNEYNPVSIVNNYASNPILSIYTVNYDRWEIRDQSNAIIEQGTGRIDTVYTDYNKYAGDSKYTLTQFVSNAYASNTSASTIDTVAVPPPEINMNSMSCNLSETVDSNIHIYQLQSQNRGGLPLYILSFDNTNTHYRIYNPDGSLLTEKDGMFGTYDITKANGFFGSADALTRFTVEQTAWNTKGGMSTRQVYIIVLKLETPTVILSANNTYIDSDLPVSVIIQDSYNTPISSSNASWVIDEVDSTGALVSGNILNGTGVISSLSVYRPIFDEERYYRITQSMTNKADVTGTGSAVFSVMFANPPAVTLTINERDANPATQKDSIYPDESLDLTSIAVDNTFPIMSTWWEVKDLSGNTALNGTGLINGLKKMPEIPGDYVIYQYAKNSKNKTGQALVPFTVKPAVPPVVNISSNLNTSDGANNTVFTGDVMNFTSNANDVNYSEQHPAGYTLKNTWAIKDNKDNVVGAYMVNELAANKQITVDKNLFTRGQTYYFRQYSENSVFPSVNAQKDVIFTVGNVKPVINIAAIQGDNVPPLFTGEDIAINLSISKPDGIITDVKFYVDDADYAAQPYFVLGNNTAKGLNTGSFTASFNYTGTESRNVTFKVIASDDYGDSSEGTIIFNVVKPTIIANIQVVNENTIQKKQDRYIELSLKNSSTNGIYPIDFTRTRIEYTTASGAWGLISSGGQNYIDSNIRVYYPNYPDMSTISLYFKTPDNYTIYARIYDTKGNSSDFAEKFLFIEEDKAPGTQFSIITPQYRITEDYVSSFSSISGVVNTANVGKAFFKLADMGTSPDNDTLQTKVITFIYDWNMDGYDNDAVHTVTITQSPGGYDSNTEIVVGTNNDSAIAVRDLSNYKITFLTDVNEMGNFYFKVYTKEAITQLPADTNPLYAEIKALEKSAESDYLKVFIDNRAPTLTFEADVPQTVNIIFHWDTTPTADEEDSINSIIDQLQAAGVKVNVIKMYGNY